MSGTGPGDGSARKSDLSILKDYIEKKFIVMTLDFGDEPNAVSPFFDDDINLVYRAAFGYLTPSVLRAIKLEPKDTRCFILPEGYRVATDLTYWEIDKHGVYGTLEYIMKTYNEEIVPKVHRDEARPEAFRHGGPQRQAFRLPRSGWTSSIRLRRRRSAPPSCTRRRSPPVTRTTDTCSRCAGTCTSSWATASIPASATGISARSPSITGTACPAIPPPCGTSTSTPTSTTSTRTTSG